MDKLPIDIIQHIGVLTDFKEDYINLGLVCKSFSRILTDATRTRLSKLRLKILSLNDFSKIIPYKIRVKDINILIYILSSLMSYIDTQTSGDERYLCGYKIFMWLTINMWIFEKYPTFKKTVMDKLKQFARSTNQKELNIYLNFGWMTDDVSHFKHLENYEIKSQSFKLEI